MNFKKDNLRILIVEDDYFLAKGMAKLIQRMSGFRVIISHKLDEVFQLCQGKEVDLIIMDIHLPEAHYEKNNVSGVDISRFLKSNPQTAKIPIILITAYAAESERQSLLNISKADDFYPKPIIDYDDLVQSINRLCGRQERK